MTSNGLPPVPPEIALAMGGAPPTDEEWRAISMPLEPAVIVAGAGSGKTSVIAARVVYLALVHSGRIAADHAGVPPGSVLCLTFTNKATDNLILRIRRALTSLDLTDGEEPTVLNYHGFANQVLERHGLLAGVEPGQRILTPAQRLELCARVLDQMAFEHVSSEWQPTLIEKILSLADQAANHRVTPREVADFARGRLAELRRYRSEKAFEAAQQRIELAEAVQRFQDLKLDRGVIDFGDQITMALDIVERFPEVRRDFRSRYQALVLDEYQDTNVAQADLIAGVFDDGFPVMAVGDPDQNIYAWRGASLFNLLNFQNQFCVRPDVPARKLPLYTNFRSGARILAAADRVLASVPEKQRADRDKLLRPHPSRGEGEVRLIRLGDEWAEAAWLADQVVEQHAAGTPWQEIAVLCRSSRLFLTLQEAFVERKVPVEIVGLAGLVNMPEVVEVLAYARAAADPEASVGLARILLGPRYRVGFKDVARVAAWARAQNRGRRGADEEEQSPFLFAEALEHLDELEYLSDEGLARLREFRAELADLRTLSRRPVGEFLAEIIRRTGLLAELDASVDAEMATATKRNLAAFLDEVHAFTPVEGDVTLRVFLDYVEALQGAERPEWSPVQPSDADSVKVMTIHQAKGLEFDVVFVPGVAADLLPDVRVQQNPAEKGQSLDFELRGDRAVLPMFTGNFRQFWFALRDQEEVEERRTFYVALTRARRRLFLTGAHWYGEGQNVKKPSAFFEELAAWGETTGLAEVDRGEDPVEENPLIGHRERFVRDWPGPALRPEVDELFAQGWRAAALAASADPSEIARAAAALSEDERVAFGAAVAEQRTLALHLLEREGAAPAPRRLPSTLGASNVIEYARCPKKFYWTVVRPLPRFSGPAARIGTQIHAWIERQAAGQATLLELEEMPDLTDEELAGEPGRVERLQRNFEVSRFGQVSPLYAERAFLLRVDAFVVSGRIDAIFGAPDGPWEVVDYKTGRKPPEDDPLSGLQLDLYALACVDVFGKPAPDLTLTYLYLQDGEMVTRLAGDPKETRARVATALAGIAARRFPTLPGEHCTWCDFRPFCSPGKEYVAQTQARG